MKKPKMAPPPAHLSDEAKGWWTKILTAWHLEDASLLVLESAMECLDRMRQAQAEIKKTGITVTDRFGQPKPSPAVLVERDSKTGLLRHLKHLAIDLEPINDGPGRPAGR